MIIQILVSQRQTVDPLRQQLLHRMLHKNRVAPIQKALGQPRQQVQPPVGLPQQQPTAVSGQRSSIETGYYLAGKMVSKLEGRLVTLCHSGSRGPFWPKHVVTNMFMPQDSAFRHLFCEKCGLTPRPAKSPGAALWFRNPVARTCRIHGSGVSFLATVPE